MGRINIQNYRKKIQNVWPFIVEILVERVNLKYLLYDCVGTWTKKQIGHRISRTGEILAHIGNIHRVLSKRARYDL